MSFKPKEILLALTGRCNLSCSHCCVEKDGRKLSPGAAKRFISGCLKRKINKIGFTGGEPFLVSGLLCEIVKFAAGKGLFFNRIMTNGIWFQSREQLLRCLLKLYRCGYDGSICVSVDRFHKRDLRKLSIFIKTSIGVFRRPDIISLASVYSGDDSGTRSVLCSLALRLGGRYLERHNGVACIKGDYFFIKIIPIDLSPVGAAARLKNPWEDVCWFKDDYCAGPGNVFFVLPDGKTLSCCGYASQERLIIGDINKDSPAKLIKMSRKNKFVNAVFTIGLGGIRKRLQGLGVKFPGKTSNHCFFCDYILTKIPESLLKRAL